MGFNVYVLTLSAESRLKSILEVKELNCYRCKIELIPGDEIASKHAIHSSKGIRVYCKECFEKLWIEL